MAAARKGGPERIEGRAPGGAKPTLRTISELTGLAVTTVSRALSNAPQLSVETRERVRRVADEIGYMPDRAALRLRTGRTNVISLVLDSHQEILGFSNSIINGLTLALRDTSLHLIVTPTFPNMPLIEPVQFIVRNRLADGIIFTRTEPFDPRVRLLLEAGFPFITHGRTEFSTPHPFVDFDNSAFAYEAKGDYANAKLDYAATLQGAASDAGSKANQAMAKVRLSLLSEAETPRTTPTSTSAPAK